jgi:hypothetical protein
METNRVFSARFFPVILPGATLAVTFNLNNLGRTSLMKSIFWDLRICRNVTFEPIPNEQNNFLFACMGTQPGIGNLVNETFGDVLGTAAFVTGQNLWFTAPGQYHFDSFYIRNILALFLNFINGDIVNTYQIYTQVIIETEDINLSQSAKPVIQQ